MLFFDINYIISYMELLMKSSTFLLIFLFFTISELIASENSFKI